MSAKTPKPKRAAALFSGGLDSALAVRLMQGQGIAVEAFLFTSLFDATEGAGLDAPQRLARDLGVPLVITDYSREFIDIVRAPSHGYGSNMNPCIDCRIFMIRRVMDLVDSGSFDFAITGEVLGQRPMSQRKDALRLIDREAGVRNLVVRPLSAKLLDPTVPEQEGWIDRELLLGMKGRSRKPQIKLAEELGIRDYPSPAGGCLLTDPQFASRLHDLLEHGSADARSIEMLKTGRHFRLGDAAKLIVGRNQADNQKLDSLAEDSDLRLTAAGVPGPLGLVVLRGGPGEELAEGAVELAAAILAAHCPKLSGRQQAGVRIRTGQQQRVAVVAVKDRTEFESMRVEAAAPKRGKRGRHSE